MRNTEADTITWEMIRIHSIMQGWNTIIARETALHLDAIWENNDPSHFCSLHIFFSKIATPEERLQMLTAGYSPLC